MEMMCEPEMSMARKEEERKREEDLTHDPVTQRDSS